MGLLGGLLKTTVGVALTPVAVVTDIVSAGDSDSTGNCVDTIAEGLEEAADSIL